MNVVVKLKITPYMIFELQNKHFGKWLPVGQLDAAAAIDRKKIVNLI